VDSVQRLFSTPRHPYTRGLLDSLPRVDQWREKLSVIEGQVPPIDAMPAGCAFAPRCAHASELCRRDVPALDGQDARLACHHPLVEHAA
jgi:oligopeptide/dipeptide ABC transporter ATP-binding protein